MSVPPRKSEPSQQEPRMCSKGRTQAELVNIVVKAGQPLKKDIYFITEEAFICEGTLPH